MSFEEALTPQERQEIRGVFECVGTVTEIPEHLLDAGMTGSSASPAFTYMYIEALADGVVALGIPRAQAYEMCAQRFWAREDGSGDGLSSWDVERSGVFPRRYDDSGCKSIGKRRISL